MNSFGVFWRVSIPSGKDLGEIIFIPSWIQGGRRGRKPFK